MNAQRIIHKYGIRSVCGGSASKGKGRGLEAYLVAMQTMLPRQEMMNDFCASQGTSI